MTCIHPKKELCGTSRFDITTTGMAYYDAMIGKGKIVGKYKDDPKGYFRNVKGIDFEIKCITPDQYFVEVAKFHSTTPDYERKVRVMKSYVEEYKNRAIKCSPMPLPILDYKDRVQEGRHRVVAASELGIQKIPVLMVKRYEK